MDYAPLAEIPGRSHLASEALNCSAPDTGNMEILTMFGTPEQQEQWLQPLLEGEIRSCFAMTEPAVASSDATNIECRIERARRRVRDQRPQVVDLGCRRRPLQGGHPHGQDRPRGTPHRQQSMVLVPMDTPGVTIVRNLPVFGYHGPGGPLRDRRSRTAGCPSSNLLGEEGGGFAIAQARLGPGRIHHCMRAIGVAERALELMCRRVQSPGGLRQAAGRAGRHPGVDRRLAASRSSRPACSP